METDGPTEDYPDTEIFFCPLPILPLVTILGGRSEGKEEVLERIS